MPELLVVADDLTGATDTGVHFASRGVAVRILPHPAGALASGEEAEVLVMDTESRHLAPAAAALRVAEAVRRGRAAGVGRFFKKTDSALRGNVGSELNALRLASGCSLLGFVPALPALGRTTRGGVQHLEGVPLHQTHFARDPLDPVRTGSVPELIRRQVDVPVAVLGVEPLRDGADAPLPDAGIVVLDAETDDDVRAAVRWLERRGLLGAVAGTSALARALADAPPWSARAEPPPFRYPSDPRPMLVVGGSLHPVSLAQLDHAAARGFATVLPFPGATARGSEPAAEEAVAAAVHHLGAGRGVLLRTAATAADAAAAHPRVAEGAGHMVRRILQRHPVPVLTVLGGDTLAGVVRALGSPALLPRREIFPGVPVSEVEGRGGMLLVSKAGSFGSDTFLTQIQDAMNQARAG